MKVGGLKRSRGVTQVDTASDDSTDAQEASISQALNATNVGISDFYMNLMPVGVPLGSALDSAN